MMSTTEYDIHDESIKSGCIQLKAHIYRHPYSKYFFESIDSMNKIIDYIVKLERENLVLKEYKKHQERANERRYRSGEESWHRGSVVEKNKEPEYEYRVISDKYSEDVEDLLNDGWSIFNVINHLIIYRKEKDVKEIQD